jgi:hypothetical protein
MTSAARIAAVICSLSMATLIRDGLDLRYEVTGAGPALLLPAFNFRWGDYLDVGLLAGLDRDGLEHASFPGHDREGMLAISTRRYPASWPGSTGYPARSERWVSRTGTLARIPRTRRAAGQPGRIAQWKSIRLTSEGSLVQSQLRPPAKTYFCGD